MIQANAIAGNLKALGIEPIWSGMVCGVATAAVVLAIRKGISRGVFSNEAGLGTAPIAAAAAKTKEPVVQTLVSMTGTFIDTICVCTLTGLVLIVTAVWNSGTEVVTMAGNAFSIGLPREWGGFTVALA
jgi:AGCS family alanine or glycine:cation symporter